MTRRDVAAFVVRMAVENLQWEDTRIRGALSNLGHEIARTTVKRILHDHGIDPAPERSRRMPGKTFLQAPWEGLTACDLFTVQALTRHVQRLPDGLMATLTWGSRPGTGGPSHLLDRHRGAGLFLRPVQSVATWDQREHQWLAAPVSAEGDRPRSLHPGSTQSDRARAQYAATQDTRLSDAGGYTRGNRCTDRLNASLQARGQNQLLEFGLGINENLDQRQVARRRGFRLATTSDCARLFLHGGFLSGGLAPGFPPAV